MRTAILILATLVLISSTFGLYMHFQPARDLSVGIIPMKVTASTTQPNAGNDTGGLLPGKGVWILQFDELTGRLVSRFRADQYFPQKNGLIHCTNPEAEFFLSSGQRMKLIGTDGDFVMKDGPDVRKGFAAKSGPSGPPNRGRINNVIIKLYDDQLFDPTIVEDPKHIIITMTTNNIDFDNDTFLITTQGYTTPEGVAVAPDEVPVHMTGEYLFEGRGLTLRWNDRDGRLELLEIAHGESLTIVHPSKTQMGPAHEGKTTRPAVATLIEQPVFEASQVTNSSSVIATPTASDRPTGTSARATTTRKASTRHSSKGRDPSASVEHTVYQANFLDNVHVTQGPGTFALADILRLHFMMKSQAADDAGAKTKGTTGPATTSRAPASSSSQTPGIPSVEPTTRPSIIADGSIDASATPPAAAPSPRSAKPTTQAEGEVPVVIKWTGKLIVAPTATAPPRPVSPGAALIELIGTAKEILVHRAGAAGQESSEIHSASLLYQTLDGSAFIDHSDAYPQVVLNRIPDAAVAATRPANTPLTQVICDALDYRATDHTATLLGKGHATVPMTPDSNKTPATAPTTLPAAPPVLDAKWEKQAKLYFVPRAGDDMSIERATFAGNVDILHPQLALKAQSLDLAFDQAPSTRPSATEPSMGDTESAAATTKPAKSSGGAVLRNMLAIDDVHCKLTNGEGKIQNIDTDRLELQTARDESGKMYPHKVYANGTVHAYDETQDLKSGQMDLTLRPAIARSKSTTAPSADAGSTVASKTSHPATAPAPGSVDTSAVELEQMIARENVVVTNREGSTAMADELHVDMQGEDPHVVLTGTHLARVTDAKHNTLTGPRILIDPHQQMAHVVGPGTLHVIRDTTPGAKPPAPTNVVWADKADVDGNANKIDVYGKVVTSSSDADGTINTASSDHVRIDLQNAPPTTRPTAVAASTAPTTGAVADAGSHRHKPASTQPSPLQMDLFKNKQPSAITLDNNAIVRSSLTAANGDILRESELRAPLIFYAIVATSDLPAHSLRVPSAGQMLTRDNRDPVAKPAAKPATKPATKPAKGDDTELASSRGATAFQWSRDLVYTEDTHLAVMRGDVIVVHQGFDDKELPVKLTSDKVFAYFEPTEKKATTRPTEPDTRPVADQQQALQLKSVRAQGHVEVTRGLNQLEGEQLDYNPTDHWLIVKGTDRAPAVFSEPTRSPVSANTIWWNTVTWHIKTLNAAGRSVK